MKLNNNPKKKTNFFLKISACAMLIFVMLAVFILPSSAVINTTDAINGGANTGSPFGSDVYYEVTIPAFTYVYTYSGEHPTVHTDSLVDLYMLDTYDVYHTVDGFAIVNGHVVMRCDGATNSYSVTTNNNSGAYDFGACDIKGYTYVTQDVNSLNRIFGIIGEMTNIYYYEDASGVSVTVYNVPEPSPIDTILGVFLGISEWLGDALIAVIPAFWTGTELTILGVLAVAALAVALVLLLVNFVRKFLQFRG